MSSTAARRPNKSPLQAIRSWFDDFRRGIRPYGRHMTTEERRRLAREAAKDPRVDQAVREFLAEHPEFRMKDARQRGVQR